MQGDHSFTCRGTGRNCERTSHESAPFAWFWFLGSNLSAQTRNTPRRRSIVRGSASTADCRARDASGRRPMRANIAPTTTPRHRGATRLARLRGTPESFYKPHNSRKRRRGQKAKLICSGMVASAILIREPAEGYQCGQIRLPSTNAATVWSLFLRHKIRKLPRCREPPPQGQDFAFGQFSRRNQQQRVSQSSTRIDLVRCLGFRYILRKAGNDAHVGLCAMIITRRACSSLMRNSPSEP